MLFTVTNTKQFYNSDPCFREFYLYLWSKDLPERTLTFGPSVERNDHLDDQRVAGRDLFYFVHF